MAIPAEYAETQCPSLSPPVYRWLASCAARRASAIDMQHATHSAVSYTATAMKAFSNTCAVRRNCDSFAFRSEKMKSESAERSSEPQVRTCPAINQTLGNLLSFSFGINQSIIRNFRSAQKSSKTRKQLAR